VDRQVSALSPDLIEALVDKARASGGPVDGVNELLNQLTKAVLERALAEEMTDHLGYDHGDPAGNGSGNSRNGHSGKTVSTTAGPVRIDVPRDRNSTFEPKMVRKGSRRIGQLDDMILSLYARGMTTRDIQAHLAEIYGVDASPALISRITDVVADEIVAWQNRPVDEIYPTSTWTRSGFACETRARWRSRPRTWSWAWTWTGASTSWGSGSPRPRARNSGTP
jgi:putative transposase